MLFARAQNHLKFGELIVFAVSRWKEQHRHCRQSCCGRRLYSALFFGAYEKCKESIKGFRFWAVAVRRERSHLNLAIVLDARAMSAMLALSVRPP